MIFYDFMTSGTPALSKQQQKWETFSKEIYALVVAVRQWHVYLFGNRFTCKSDHNPLMTIKAKKDPQGKIGRWLMELEEYDFQIVHVPGKENVKADFLSRLSPGVEAPPSALEGNIYHINQVHFDDHLKQEQSQDFVISKAKDDIETRGSVTMGLLKESIEKFESR